MNEPTLPLSALSEPAAIVDDRGDVQATNEAALPVARLFAAEELAPVLAAARVGGVARATLADPAHDRSWSVSATRLADGRVLVVLFDLRPAVHAERSATMSRLVHELRNMAFGLDLTIDGLGSEATQGVELTSQRLRRLALALDAWIEPHEGTGEPFSLRQLARLVVEHARSDRVAVELRDESDDESDDEASAWGRRDLVQRALQAVVREAVAHAAEGTTVELEVRLGADRHALVVRSRRRLPRGADERAGRAPIRGRDVDAGLGLPIARRLVVDEGGALEVGEDAEGRAVVTLSVRSARSPE